jgi:hypothetical protein
MNNSENKHQFEDMPSNILDIKDRILEEIGMEETSKIIMSLMSALTEVMVRTAPSMASALETVDGLSISMTESIKACDSAGICNWSDRVQ